MVNQEHGFVFVSVPKCATHTLNGLLVKRSEAELLGGRFHGRNVPPEYGEFFKFTVVRNPFSRAVSIWQSTTQRGHDRYHVRKSMGQHADDFEQFAFLPFHRWLGRRQFDCVMRTEQLLADVNRLPFVRSPIFGLDRKNATVRQQRAWQEYYTPRATGHVRQWAGEDLERYGYEENPRLSQSGS